MDNEEKRALGEQACQKATRYELDYGCCPCQQCARATGTVTRWVVEML